jgi:hypothetical protein
MYRILTASKDTYITNRIINNRFRATDANVGQAGTLDLFKLVDESTSGSIKSGVFELSRILIKFNYQQLHDLTGTKLDLNHSSFKCTLRLFDVYGGQPTPSNFKTIVFPLSQAFDEGIGRDVFQFADVDACNFITASTSNGESTKWYTSGANQQGFLGAPDIDIIASGTLSGSTTNAAIWKQQLFSTGEEDLNIDITQIVSATMVGQLPDHGFRISYSGTQETDGRSRFVKRFASRHSSNTRITPRIIVQYDDSIHDHHSNFIFDVSSSLFINNFHRGVPANILSGTRAQGVSGSNCLLVKLESGSFSQTTTGSQHKIGNSFITGVYSSSFAISSYNSTLRNEIVTAGSATFNEYWLSLDGSIGYKTGVLVINDVNRTTYKKNIRNLIIRIVNLRPNYISTENVILKVHVRDTLEPVKYVKIPREQKSLIFNKMYYRIRDAYTGDIIIPFDKTNNSTILSTDSGGMYFELYMDSLDIGRVYTIDFLINDANYDQVFSDVARFRVDI